MKPDSDILDDLEAWEGHPRFRGELLGYGKLERFQELKCKSRSGRLRAEHDLDKDGKCVFCDKQTEEKA